MGYSHFMKKLATSSPTGLGWAFVGKLKSFSEITKARFRTEVERRFVDDLIAYLDYKIREAEWIRSEKKQLSFW